MTPSGPAAGDGPAPWPPAPPGTRWLLRLPNWIGDAILVLPALRALPRRGQRWVGAAHPRVAPLYRATGWFESVLAAQGASAPVGLRGVLRAYGPDRAVVFPEAVSGPLVARMSGAPLRLGWALPAGRALLTDAVAPIDRAEPLWRAYGRLARAAGGRIPEPPDFTLDPGPEAAAFAERALPGAGSRRVALAPGASYGPAKRWPEDAFLEVARTLLARGCEVVVVGGVEDREAAAGLRGAGAIDLTGATSAPEAIAVFARCRAAVTNDSGALHLARAAGIPVVAVFGSSSPAWTGPTPAEGEALWLDLDCSPCFARRCPLEGEAHLACLRGIRPGRVLEALGRAGVR